MVSQRTVGSCCGRAVRYSGTHDAAARYARCHYPGTHDAAARYARHRSRSARSRGRCASREPGRRDDSGAVAAAGGGGWTRCGACRRRGSLAAGGVLRCGVRHGRGYCCAVSIRVTGVTTASVVEDCWCCRGLRPSARIQGGGLRRGRPSGRVSDRMVTPRMCRARSGGPMSAGVVDAGGRCG